MVVHAPSGKGKTTLLSVLYGLRNDYAGQVYFDEIEIHALRLSGWSRLRKTQLSFVFQDLQLFHDLTARQNVELKNHLTAHKTQAEIGGMFEILGIAACMNEPGARLSLGQKQRVAIIRALCQPFAFLLLDEPFSHLDLENRRKAVALIREECGKQEAGYIMTNLASEAELPSQMVLQL